MSLFGFDLIVPVRSVRRTEKGTEKGMEKGINDRRIERGIEDNNDNNNNSRMSVGWVDNGSNNNNNNNYTNNNGDTNGDNRSNSAWVEDESFTAEERVTWTESRGNCCGSSSEDCKCYDRNIETVWNTDKDGDNDNNNNNNDNDNNNDNNGHCIIQQGNKNKINNTNIPHTDHTNHTNCSNKYEEKELELVVIDVNYFPSYKEVPDFPQKLRKFLRQKANMTPMAATLQL